jgi:hypothetical protein
LWPVTTDCTCETVKGVYSDIGNPDEVN